MTDDSVHDREVRRDVGQLVRWALALIVVAALVALCIDNRRDVRIGWVFGDGEAPIWLVILVAGVGGAVVGWLFAHRPRHRR